MKRRHVKEYAIYLFHVLLNVCLSCISTYVYAKMWAALLVVYYKNHSKTNRYVICNYVGKSFQKCRCETI